MPCLLDPNFRRTILFLSHHDPEEGCVGFILNRPSGDSCGNLDGAPAEMDRIALYEGGPVDRGNLVVARLHWSNEAARFNSFDGEILEEGTHSPGFDRLELMAFAGHSGWSAGQLEREIEEKSWLILPPTGPLIEPVATPEEGVARWKGIMRGLGPLYGLLAEAPDDPSLN
jgi:putative transcriptional regulator